MCGKLSDATKRGVVGRIPRVTLSIRGVIPRCDKSGFALSHNGFELLFETVLKDILEFKYFRIKKLKKLTTLI